MGKDSSVKHLMNACPSCGEVMDVSLCDPYSKVICPECSTAIRVRADFLHFRIEKKIGEGGLSRVFRAVDQTLNRLVALKVLSPEFSKDSKRAKEFEREARITASISHPNVVKVFSAGSDQEHYFMAMELVSGGSLDRLIHSKGKIVEKRALKIGAEIVNGLQAAQNSGLIHRDVKPGNILFSDEGVSKIVDFGLAKRELNKKTDSEEMWATPYYVPPEKLYGETEDFRSDIYSLGATLFHALSGVPPCSSDTSSIEELKILKQKKISLEVSAPNISIATCELVDRMMEKSPENRHGSYEDLLDDFISSTKKDYISIRKSFFEKDHKNNHLDIETARKRKFQEDWDTYAIIDPKLKGKKVIKDFPLAELVDYIDWGPFFHTWELKGKYPDILKNEKYGEQAKLLLDDANAMLNEIIKNNELTADAVFGIYQATSKDENVTVEGHKFNFPRQLVDKGSDKINYSLADFISTNQDWIGMFAVTAGKGIESIISRYEKEHDDYKIIMIKAIADRLAEAFAEKLHQMIRVDFWGYSSEEDLEIKNLIKEEYDGIRPAPGYPACPDHEEKDKIWQILDVEKEVGISLTESRAMYPAASVSGWYFSHPKSKYFSVLNN